MTAPRRVPDEAEAAKVPGPLRDRLDDLDRRLLDLVVGRMELCLDIARSKAGHGIPMMQPSRVGLVVGRARAHAAAHGLPEHCPGELFELIVAGTCAQEGMLMAELNGADDR
ncbi:chorismate mutase [Streptomyces sp. NPDC048295]|uniref:chorismate mutase n=1 Tax=Streptomyces sp. NPDC048295 TaxID=3154617 RepID=UPI003430E383